ncbi:hypothetical protein FACS189461_3870 [Spirochaetia bacterium]|nr:hypothetical protein FACS189461_3870 [Spirochaetia bacterium]
MVRFVKTIFGFLLVMGVSGCASSADPNTAQIERALKKASATVISTLPKEGTIAIINITSDDSEVSDFITGELEYILVAKGYTLVDRSQLDKIRQEQNFQLSGDVDDSSVVSLGKFAGAKIVITGTITGSGSMRRFRLRALDTETARVLGAASEALPDRTGSPQTGAATSASSNTASYRIGNRGPAGGIVFYDKGNFSDGWRYLEAAPVETEFTSKWLDTFKDMSSTTGTKIGDGASNTEYLSRRLDGEDQPPRRCKELKYNGFSDWFLPSLGELRMMYENLKMKGLGSFGDNYWSSSVIGTQGDPRAITSTYYFAFNNVGNERSRNNMFYDFDFEDEGDKFSVRAVRQF